MKREDVEKKVRSAYSGLAPDILETVLSDAERQKGNGTAMEYGRKKRSMRSRLIAAAAALALMIGGAFGMNAYNEARGIAARIMLDVNPSMEISINSSEKVLGVKALNDDAKAVIGDMDLKGSSLEVTVNALIGSMLRNGYLSDEANSVLVSVASSDEAKGKDLELRLMDEIGGILSGSRLDGSVIGQVIAEDSAAKDLAEKQSISEGRAAYIIKLADAVNEAEREKAEKKGSGAEAKTVSAEQLAGLSVNDLNLISPSSGSGVKDVSRTGTASSGRYIGEAAAKSAALSHAAVNAGDAKFISCEFELDDGVMVYDIEFTSGGNYYEYEINALDGSIRDFEIDMPRSYVTVLPKGSETEKAPAGATGAENAQGGGSGTGNTQGSASGSVKAPERPPEAEKALDSALEKAGLSIDEVRGISVKKDTENGTVVYEVEFKAGGNEYDFDISEDGKVVLREEKEADDDLFDDDRYDDDRYERDDDDRFDDDRYERDDDDDRFDDDRYERDDDDDRFDPDDDDDDDRDD